MTVADVIDLVRRDRQPIFTGGALGSLRHDAHDALDDIVDIRKVTLAVAVIEYLYSFTGAQLVCKAEVCHVWTPGGTVHREETQTGARDVIELRVCMRHKLIRFLGRGVETDRVIDLVVGRVGNFFVAAVDRGAGGIYKMLHALCAVII